MTFEEIKYQIINKPTHLYPKNIILENIDVINQQYDIDLSVLNINQIGQIIQKDLECKCVCGKLKIWKRSSIQSTCGNKECITKHIKNVFINKYGEDSPQKVDIFKEKTKNTNMIRFGKTSFLSTDNFQTKSKQTHTERYGVSNYSKLKSRNDNMKLASGIKNISDMNKEFIIENFIDDNLNIKMNEIMNYFNYKNTTSIYYLLLDLGIEYNRLGGTSYAETEINKYIQLLVYNNIILNTRKIISPLEIDIYIPDYNLAIEFNGSYWHSYGLNNLSPNQSDKFFQKNRHLDKTEKFESISENNQLFHIFENEWTDDTKRDIWKSIIKDKLKLNQRIFAKNTIIKEVSSAEANKFIFENHIQGIRNASIRIGLYVNNELLSIMTFGKPLNKSSEEYELIRFCNKKFTSVVGGASKLLKYFEKTYKPKSLLSYANRRWSKGNLYHKLGFELQSISQPNKFIIKDNKIFNRIGFQKHKIEEKFEIYDSALSADENIINNGYRIIWDSGNYIFSKKY